jgi:hypothetical protein
MIPFSATEVHPEPKSRLVLCLILAATPITAQTFGEITGTVTDSSNAVVAGASVQVTNVATSQVRQVETNDTGNYTVPFLAPGVYQVRVEKPGLIRSPVSSAPATRLYAEICSNRKNGSMYSAGDNAPLSTRLLAK